MKLWAELTMSLHQLDMASITEGGLGRRVMARSCPERGTEEEEDNTHTVRHTHTHTCTRSVLSGDIKIQTSFSPSSS